MTTRPNHGFLLLLILSLALPLAALAQEDGIAPCCEIIAFDRRTGTVTGLEAATGKTFQFIATPAQRRTLKVGQKLWANFGTQKVSVDGADPCCSMVNLTPGTTAAGQVRGRVNPVDPCCAIGSINASTGVVTATVTATGRVFQFKVADRALLGTLTPGQKVWADFGAGRVRIHGISPCCAIVDRP